MNLTKLRQILTQFQLSLKFQVSGFTENTDRLVNIS